MRQNFNLEAASPVGNTFIYSSWVHQGCRPRWSDQYGVGTWNARQQARDSVCFFCVEPCRDPLVWGGDASIDTAYEMRLAEYVDRAGDSGNVWNAAPIPKLEMKLFEDCSDVSQQDPTQAASAFSACDTKIQADFGQTVWDSGFSPKTDAGNGPNMKKLNYYSVLDDVMLYNTEKFSNHKMSLMQDVSRIQFAQINARDTLDFMTDAVATGSKLLYSLLYAIKSYKSKTKG